jgi:hypothetical protein
VIICAYDELNTSLKGKLRETYDKLKRKQAPRSTGALAIQGLRSNAPICARDQTLALDSHAHGIPRGCCGYGGTEQPVAAFFEQRCFYFRGRSYGAILLLAGLPPISSL